MRRLIVLVLLLTACNMNLKTGGLLASSPSGGSGKSGRSPASKTSNAPATPEKDGSEPKNEASPGSGDKAAKSDASAGEQSTKTASNNAARTPELIYDEKDPTCYWFPTLVMRQHEGGGAYGPVIHDWDLDLQLNAREWRRMAKAYADKNKLTLDSTGTRGPIDCAKVAKVASDASLLKAIRKKKSEPDAWLAAQSLPGEDWQVETNQLNQPVSKTRAILVYKRGGMPKSIDLR